MVHSYAGTHGVKTKKNFFRQYSDSASARALRVGAS